MVSLFSSLNFTVSRAAARNCCSKLCKVLCPFALREVRKSAKVSSAVAAQLSLNFFTTSDILIFGLYIKNNSQKSSTQVCIDS